MVPLSPTATKALLPNPTPQRLFAVAEVTQATLVSWVEDQLQNTAAEFDAAIANAKTQAEYQAGFKKYEREADNTYAIPAVDAEVSTY